MKTLKLLSAALVSASLLASAACGPSCNHGSECSSSDAAGWLAVAVLLGSSCHLTISPDQQRGLDDGSLIVDPPAAEACVHALAEAPAEQPEPCTHMLVQPSQP